MKGFIGFANQQISCIIGDLPYERENPQEIYVDLKVETDFTACIHSDRVQDTVNYVELIQLCEKIAVEGQFYLLEKYAFEVLTSLRKFPLSSAWICVKKPEIFPTIKYAYVELKLDYL